jgi:putative membrane protein
MLNQEPKNTYVEKIVKRYSKLFGLPSQNRLTTYFALLIIHSSIISFLFLGFTLENFIGGLVYGITFFVFSFLSDIIISKIFLKEDLIFNLRRCFGLSFFSSLIWFGIFLIGSLITGFLGITDYWIRFFFLGFSGALILRLLILSITSFASFKISFLSSIFQPIVVVFPIFFIKYPLNIEFSFQILSFFLIAIIIALLVVYTFKYSMDSVGARFLGIPSSLLFKSFLANWTEGLVVPLENFFETLGYEKDVAVSSLSFKVNSKLKAVIIVPALHPGPFNNLGSSLLPSLIQKSIQNKFDCVVSVPHGLVGHELDVASQLYNKKVVNTILGFFKNLPLTSKATPFLRTQENDAKVSCQILGDCAFLTLTTAPKTMEDLPPELNASIIEVAKKMGVSALSIDAHNSMDGDFDLETAIISLRKAAITALKKAIEHEKSTFKIGAAAVVPNDFTVEQGMGHGGISVLVIEVGIQKVAYVTIDGNNMVSGLREKILKALEDLGINDGEILTTDTHSVCGRIRTSRGYNLVGEAIDHNALIDYVKQTTIHALKNMQPAEVAFKTELIPKIKVIGEKQISELTILADKTTEFVKRVAVVLFPIASVFLTILLLFIL